ncbi:ROK family transcriptional regulator [Streptomyces sp. NPDC050355]|uniref:ROK family transcriptional regulator n=1 Tax=Streptomyces sp. NPDC050355 TaxID=3365609 RepID=UPI003795F4BD
MLQLRAFLGPGGGTRATNRRRILIAVMIKADSQTGIARRTQLSQGTVSSAVKELERDGVVQVDRAAHSAGAGRGTLVQLCPADGVAVGVHIGYSEATVVARRVDLEHGDVFVQHTRGGADHGLQAVLPRIKEMIGSVVDETGLGLKDVLSLGVAVPGMLDPRLNRFATPVLPPWNAEDDPAGGLGEWLRTAGGAMVPAVQDNDANLAALAEQTYDTEEHAETLVYVKASTGVGAGVVIGNRVIRGERGMAGEIGHLTLRPDGAMCHCGGRGCLDTIVGGDALVGQVRQALKARRATDLPRDLPSLIARAKAQDAVCLRVLQDAGHTLGFALAQVCNLLNPNLIVLGGHLASAGDIVLEPCRQSLRRYALRGAVSDGFRLRLSALDTLAEAQGALVLGLSKHEVSGEE